MHCQGVGIMGVQGILGTLLFIASAGLAASILVFSIHMYRRMNPRKPTSPAEALRMLVACDKKRGTAMRRVGTFSVKVSGGR